MADLSTALRTLEHVLLDTCQRQGALEASVLDLSTRIHAPQQGVLAEIDALKNSHRAVGDSVTGVRVALEALHNDQGPGMTQGAQALSESVAALGGRMDGLQQSQTEFQTQVLSAIGQLQRSMRENSWQMARTFNYNAGGTTRLMPLEFAAGPPHPTFPANRVALNNMNPAQVDALLAAYEQQAQGSEADKRAALEAFIGVML